ncbi:adenylate kinase isoenzyme 1-like [Osmia bicornis bicornis]|uniref:adenylate kinase isoenzyme 1-like n=1 Tax=Osmia bicornis bicornis TaxID=1437191 RepID=UPI0010F85F97|nr:adenylate kinase isoenzyme 1-like [Osmia bicornis bicornis]
MKLDSKNCKLKQKFPRYITRTGRAVKCVSSVAAGETRDSKIKRISKTIVSMGNCIKAADPSMASLPRGINVDTSRIRESGLPIIFLIGGPGVGKRTLCSKVAEKYGFLGIISTDLIRTEVSTRTERAFLLARMMSQGQLVPTDVLIELIAVRMIDFLDEKNGFIVSGFPRHKDQCKVFDKLIRPPDLVLFMEARNSVLSDRIMARAITTMERVSISFDSIRKQIKQFHKRNKPVVTYYNYKNLLVMIDGEPEAITVYENVCEVIDNLLLNFPTRSSNVEEINVISDDIVPKNNEE